MAPLGGDIDTSLHDYGRMLALVQCILQRLPPSIEADPHFGVAVTYARPFPAHLGLTSCCITSPPVAQAWQAPEWRPLSTNSAELDRIMAYDE